MPPPARICGRSATTGRSRTCSQSRTRSRAASSPPSPPACWRRARPPRGAGRPTDVRAYDLFLQGLRLSDSFAPGAQAQARELFERARELDPTFARAYTGLAFNHLSRAPTTASGGRAGEDPDRARGAAPGRAGPGARPERPAGPLHAGLHVPDVARLRSRRASPRSGAGHEPERRADPDHLGVGPGLPRRPRAGAARGRAGHAAQPAPPPLLRALPLAHPVPRPAPRRGPGRPRADHGRGSPRRIRATWRGGRRPAVTWGGPRKRNGAP